VCPISPERTNGYGSRLGGRDDESGCLKYESETRKILILRRRVSAVSKDRPQASEDAQRPELHGSPGDAKHRPERALETRSP
jgi:hypothetical protein